MLNLVTGSTGLLGNNVVRLLIDQGEKVRVLIRGQQPPPPLHGLPVEIVYGDLSNTSALEQAVEGVDAVIHSAGFVRIGWSGWSESRTVNVEGSRHLAQAALEQQARFVHVSTVNTLGLGSPDAPANEESPSENHVRCPYVVSKSEGEQIIQGLVSRGLHATIVNPGFMLGPWDWKPSSGAMLKEIVTRFTPAAPPGGCSVVDVRDVARGLILARDHGVPGRQYIMAGENISYFELWQRMAKIGNSTGPKFKIGPVVRWGSGLWGDLVYRCTGKEPLVNSAAIKMSAQYHYYSSQRAIDELGYEFRPADEAITAAYQWFKEHDYL